MAISDRVRKALWANSGNRCAMCRRELVVLGEQDGHSIVGQECHIVSSRPTGPRFGEDVPGGDIDAFDNLILLCGGDHTLIDQAVLEYPVKRLCEMKAAHEAWWKATLAKNSEPVRRRRGAIPILTEIANARELLSILADAEESSLDSEDPADERELAEVGGFLQDLRDYGDIWDDLEPAARMRATFDLGRELKDLRDCGWRVFGALAHGTLSGGHGSLTNWNSAYVFVVRKDSPQIVQFSRPDGD